MKKLHLLKTVLLLCALIVGSGNLWATETTYIFTSKSWGATLSGQAANWTSGKDAGNFISGQGIQVTNNASYTGANGTSPKSFTSISKIVVTYNTNQSGGAGNIVAKVGSNEAKTNNVAYSTGDGRSAMYTTQFDFSPAQTGSVTLTVNTTTNSIYLYSVTITHEGLAPAGLGFPETNYVTTCGASFVTPTLTNPNDLTVTYSTSDATVADVNSSTGVVTIKDKAGSATITASFDGDATYEAGSASYTIHVYAHTGTTPESPFTVAEATDFITNKLYDAEAVYYVHGIVSAVGSLIAASGKLSYHISDDGTTTNQLQVYRGLNLSESKFTAESDLTAGSDDVVVVGPLTYHNNTTPEINDGNYLYKKGDIVSPTLTVGAVNIEVTQERDVATLYTTNSTGAVTITSSATDVANIVGSKLETYKPGTATITVSIDAAAGTWAAISKSFTLTVTAKEGVIPVGASYNLVTDGSSLANGDQLLVVGMYSEDAYVMAGQGDHIRVTTPVTVSDNKITSIPSAAQLVTLEKDGDKWLFNVGTDAYLYASGGTSKNQVDTGTKTSASTTAQATITIGDGGAATVTFNITGSGAKNSFRFNYNSGNPRFTCYASGQQPVYFYRYEKPTTTYDINIGSAGWRTIVPAASATLPSGVKAYYVASNVTAGVATLTEVNSIKAGEAYLLSGTAGDHTLTVTASPTEPTGNKLRVSTELDGNGAFVLAKKSQGVGFYLWNGGSLGAGRVILPASAIDSFSSAHEFIGFDGGTTGIADVRGKMSDVRGDFYNLAGQRVAQPTKGLYIVNGKKIIMK